MARKSKTYAALVGLGLTALIVDRSFFQATSPDLGLAAGPRVDADAAPSGQQTPSVTASAPVAKMTIPELRFPRDLPVYDPQAPLRDVFAPVSSASDANGQSPGAKTAASGKSDPERAFGRAAFEAAHRVDALMVQDRLKIAVVDGRWMRIGEQVDECTLSRIEGDVATFQCHDGEAVLSPSRRNPRAD